MKDNSRPAGRDGELFGKFARLVNARYARCLGPDIFCDKPAIRAHSIQNSRVLDLIAVDGHVMVLEARITTDGPLVSLRRVGRNMASTFTGLCADHDQEMFRPIDAAAIDLENPEHLFLVAYRAAYREFHACLQTAMRLQTAYLERVDSGLDPPHTPTPAGLLAAHRIAAAHEMFECKVALDDGRARRDFGFMTHNVIRLERQAPTIAVCSLYSVDHLAGTESTLRIHLNVLPLSQTETAVVFSYAAADAGLARAHLDRVLNSSGAHHKYELSRVIVENCENFVLNPDYVASWSDKKRRTVEAVAADVMPAQDNHAESVNLYLF